MSFRQRNPLAFVTFLKTSSVQTCVTETAPPSSPLALVEVTVRSMSMSRTSLSCYLLYNTVYSYNSIFYGHSDGFGYSNSCLLYPKEHSNGSEKNCSCLEFSVVDGGHAFLVEMPSQCRAYYPVTGAVEGAGWSCQSCSAWPCSTGQQLQAHKGLCATLRPCI